MPNFKPKTAKKIKVNKTAIATLDDKHNEKMKEFNKLEDIDIPKIEKKIKELQEKINTVQDIEKKKDIEYEIKKLKKKHKNLKHQKKKYLLDNSEYIFNYFEKKKTISKGNTKKVLLNNFFSKNKVKTNIDIKNNQNEENDLQKYLSNIDDSFIKVENYVKISNVCYKCKGEMVPISYEGITVCKECGIQIPYLIEHEKPSYKEPPKEVCFYAYKRINHFREILAQFQAKETTQIPDEVLDNIKRQIVKERITIESLTNKKTKDILKNLGYNKYYEHIPFIKDKLGIKPPVIPPELEATLCNLFNEIQKPWSKHSPNNRLNFLHYYFTLYKLCELLGEEQYLKHIPLLKDREKLIEQDEVWKKICKELQWEFIPTV